MFSRTPKKITEFSFEFMDRKINFILRIYAEGQFSTQSTALTKTELLLEFEKTNDLDFLVKLFTVVDDMFCFLCNRRNITLNCATLVSERAKKYPNRKDGKIFIDERHVYTSQTLVVINKYRDKGENEKAIQKTIQYTLLSKRFEQLFSMFVDNEVSIFSIHSSLAARSLIDLKQSLHITATFEYYYRRYIPDIPSEDSLEFYNEIKGLLQEYVNNNTGKKKKKAKSLIKGISPEPSLMDKILKVYRGCSEWKSLELVLDEWFDSNVDELAEVANEWRNELAHEKREYEPDIRVVSAIRLVEHLNYCIIFRQAGYSDEEIKSILDVLLVK